MRNLHIAGDLPLGPAGRLFLNPAILIWLTLSTPGLARAQSAADLPIAQALFEEARTLMAAGRYDEACPKLSESQRLDPATGTLLNLAVCHERQGKTATAWAKYNDVVAASRMDGNAERQRIAVERIRELEPKLCRLSVVSPDAKTQASLVVRLDGVELRPAALGTAMPVDPGVHEVEVMAKGKKSWAGKVVLTGNGASNVITVLAPEDDPAMRPGPVAEARPRADRRRRSFAYVAGATGFAAIGVGAYFGLRASEEWDERNAHCTGIVCDDSAASAASRARVLAIGANGAFALGLAGLGTAVYLALTSGSTTAATVAPVGVWVASNRAEIAWRGQF